MAKTDDSRSTLIAEAEVSEEAISEWKLLWSTFRAKTMNSSYKNRNACEGTSTDFLNHLRKAQLVHVARISHLPDKVTILTSPQRFKGKANEYEAMSMLNKAITPLETSEHSELHIYHSVQLHTLPGTCRLRRRLEFVRRHHQRPIINFTPGWCRKLL